MRKEDVSMKTQTLLICCYEERVPGSGFAHRNSLKPSSYRGSDGTLWYHPFLFAQAGSGASKLPAAKARSVMGKLCYRGVASAPSGGGPASIVSFWPVSKEESDAADIPFESGADLRFVKGLNCVDSYVYAGDRIIWLPGYMIALLPDLLPKVYRTKAPKRRA
jgi:hypothetical protein